MTMKTKRELEEEVKILSDKLDNLSSCFQAFCSLSGLEKRFKDIEIRLTDLERRMRPRVN